MSVYWRGLSSFVVGETFRRLQEISDLRTFEIKQETVHELLKNPPPANAAYEIHTSYQIKAKEALNWIKENLPSKYSYYTNLFSEYLNLLNKIGLNDANEVKRSTTKISHTNIHPNTLKLLTNKTPKPTLTISYIARETLYNFGKLYLEKTWIRSLVVATILATCFPMTNLCYILATNVAIAVLEKRIINNL